MATVSEFHEHGILHKKGMASSFGLMFSAIFAVALLSFSPAVSAQNMSKLVSFDIKAQPLGRALLEFGKQAHLQIMFASKSAVGRIRTREIKGKYTGEHVLALLLRHTGLTYTEHRASIEVMPIRAGQSGSKPVTTKNAQRKSSTDVQRENDPPPPAPRKKTSNKAALREVTITGSRLRRTSKYEAQEVQVYDREKISQSGQTSVYNFLRTLPSVSLSSTSSALGEAATVQLRGLPVGTTLVLLDGRRIEDGGIGYWESGVPFFDLNNIPLAAIKRIEVTESGSSAVYGSDAIAGVVNIILRKHFDGLEANARYGWAKDFDEAHADIAWGKQWSNYGISLIGSYATTGSLLSSQRQLSASNDYTQYGGPDNNYPVCFPGNVFSTNGMPLPGAPSGSAATYAAVTGSTAAGRPPFSQFTYGALNTCSILYGFALLPATHRASVLLESHIDLTPAIELFSELMYTRLRQTVYGGSPGLFGLPGYQSYTVSPNNPYNPFGTSVGVALSLRQLQASTAYSTEFFRPLVGVKGTISQRWQWELTSWQSIDWSQYLNSNGLDNASEIQAALDSSDPATALNPFVTGSVVPQQLLHSLFGSANIKWMSRDRYVQAFMRGPVLRAPTGTIRAVIGATYVQSVFYENDIRSVSASEPANTRRNYRRDHYAMFGEAKIPLIWKFSPRGRPRHLLTLTIAGRHDQYSDVGGSTTGQFGFLLTPVDGVVIRGTYGDAFKAPSLPQLYSPDTLSSDYVTDPNTQAVTPITLILGGNQSLRPMTGHSHTIGIIYASHALTGLTISATQWQVVEENAIQNLGPQNIVNNQGDFPGRIIRNSSGVITTVNSTFVNFGHIDVAGIDYDAEYKHSFESNTLSLGASATETYRYNQALIPGVPGTNAVAAAQTDGDWAPRWKGVVHVNVGHMGIKAHLDGRYTGIYKDYNSSRRIGNFWIFDANIRCPTGRWLWADNPRLRRMYVEFGAMNLFNRAPQFSNWNYDFYGYDGSQFSVLGRELYARTGIRW